MVLGVTEWIGAILGWNGVRCNGGEKIGHLDVKLLHIRSNPFIISDTITGRF